MKYSSFDKFKFFVAGATIMNNSSFWTADVQSNKKISSNLEQTVIVEPTQAEQQEQQEQEEENNG